MARIRPSYKGRGRAIGGALPDLSRFRQRHRLHLVGLQPRQDLGREAADLVHEHVVGHGAAIEADLHHVGAGGVGLGDDALGHLVGRAPGHALGHALDIGHGHVAEVLAQQRRGALVLRPHVVGRGLADVAHLPLRRRLGEAAVAEQGAIEIEVIGRHLLHRLRLGVGDIGVEAERQVVGRDAMPGRGQALGIEADDVVAQAAAGQARRDRDVVPAGELDRFLAADDRDPDRRMRPLHRPRPDRHVLVRPELPRVGEHVLGPGAGDDVVGLLEAGARFVERHVVHLVLARDAARKARDDAAVGQAIEHRQLLGQPQRLVQRQQVAVDQELQPLGALRRRRRPSGWASSSGRRASSDAR